MSNFSTDFNKEANSIQVAGFLDNSLVNGRGLRSVIFVSGCKANCHNCQNKEMQSFDYGDRISIDEIYHRIKNNIPIISGVTFSGGEPFLQAESLSKLAEKIKKAELNLWCYSGYTFEYILDHQDDMKGWRQLLQMLDVLVDGKFEESKKSSALKYRGSSNQRIIDVQESLQKGKTVVLNFDMD